jgi:hypothetical protein
MAGRVLLIIVLALFSFTRGNAQMFINTSDLFARSSESGRTGELNIYQDRGVDTLMSRYLAGNRLLKGGMEGYRIQIYRSSARNAREESSKTRAEFMLEYPDMTSYAEYAEPGYFIVKVGDFRTRMDGTKSLYQIRRKYPNAYMVPSVINFPDLNKK